MLSHQTARTKSSFTLITNHNWHLVSLISNNTFTLTSRTHLFVLILQSQVEIMNLLIFLLNLNRQLFKQTSFHIQKFSANRIRTSNFKKLINHINYIFMQARLAVIELMLTGSYVQIEIRCALFATNLTLNGLRRTTSICWLPWVQKIIKVI